MSFRKNGNVEHHSEISKPLLGRDFEYIAILHNASGKIIHPYIFNTGRIPHFEVEFATPTSCYNPVWINTQEIEHSVKLNNIKYKISKLEEINVFDVCDLIWMPKFRSNKSVEDIIMEIVEIFNDMLIEERLLEILRKCLKIWAGKFVKDKNKIQDVIRGLNMSAMETDELVSKVMKTARIEGELYRSYESGIDKGLKDGERIGLEKGLAEGLAEGRKEGLMEGREEGREDTEFKFVSKLLEKYTPQEISDEYDVPLEKVFAIQNEKLKISE